MPQAPERLLFMVFSDWVDWRRAFEAREIILRLREPSRLHPPDFSLECAIGSRGAQEPDTPALSRMLTVAFLMTVRNSTLKNS